ncbi:MAG: ParB N-terminal domain-containing protein [Eubacteriales bacterium]
MSFLTAAISQMETSKSQMQQIGIERIHLDPTNDTLYPRFDPENCADDRDLIESIREVGLLQPLCVRRHGQLTDEYIVISGHRRLQACQVARIKKVECLILSADTQEEQITMKMDLVLSNRTRDRSNPAIQAKEVAFLENHMRELKKIRPDRFKGFTIRSLVAAELGVSERTVASAEKINNNLDQETYSAFMAGELSQRKALEAADNKRIAAGKKTRTEYLNFDETALPAKEDISKLLYTQLICSAAIEKIEDKSVFLAKLKEHHLRGHHGHSDQNFIAQFDPKGLILKLPSNSKEIRLTPNQIYNATLWEYQSQQQNRIETQSCVDKAAVQKTFYKGNEDTDKNIVLRMGKKLEDCASRLQDNPQLWNDKIVQNTFLSLEKRIEDLLNKMLVDENHTNEKHHTEVFS